MFRHPYVLNFTVLILGVAIVAIGGSFLARQIQAGKELDRWMAQEPAVQMILNRHPERINQMKEFFRGPYVRQGLEGMERAKADQIYFWIRSDLADYVWQYEDSTISEYVSRELVFVEALNARGQNQGACEAFMAGQERQGLVREMAGADVYDSWVKAGENLLLSARGKYVHPLTLPQYDAKMREAFYQRALFIVISKGQELRPDLPLAQQVEIIKAPDPKKSCGDYAHALKALAQVDPATRSLVWRYQRFQDSVHFISDDSKSR